MYFGLFWFSWKNFSIRENEHPSSIKEKMGGGGRVEGEGDASLIFGASLARR